EIPEDARIRPQGALTIRLRRGDERAETLVLEPTGEERRDARRRALRLGYRASAESRLTYRPGDTLWADLAVRFGENTEGMLTWTRHRSQVYEFERLVRPPRLHRKDQEATEGEI